MACNIMHGALIALTFFLRLGLLHGLTIKHGRYPNSCRWFQDYDSAAYVLEIRHARGLLVDVSIMCQNASPYRHQVDFADNLSVVFAKERGHSLQVASHLLRDHAMWQVLQMRKDICAHFREEHGMRIKMDRKGLASCELSLQIREKWASGTWIASGNHILSFFNAELPIYEKWGLVVAQGGPGGRNPHGGQEGRTTMEHNSDIGGKGGHPDFQNRFLGTR